MEAIQKQLTDKLLSSKLERYPASLFHGKTGLSIYFFYLSRIESNPAYYAFADKLLDQVLLYDLSKNHSIDMEDGLAGVGLGVTWLVKNRFIEADLNELLQVIDDAIFRRIAFQNDASNVLAIQLLHLTGYLYVRLKDSTIETDNDPSLQKDLIIKTMNQLYPKIDDDFLNESYTFSVYHYQLPVLLWVIGKLLDAGFYNDRIYKMLDELKPRILSRFPLLHSNRLFLLWGMLNLKPFLHDDHARWNSYIRLLHREIDLDEILKNEMTDRKIFVDNGLSGIYLLLHTINKTFPDYPIPFDPQTIYDRVQNSDAWKTMLERDYFYQIRHGLFNGFPGVGLVLAHIENSYELRVKSYKQ